MDVDAGVCPGGPVGLAGGRKAQLTGLISKAVAGVQAADGATKVKLRKKSLGRALKALGGFGKKLKSKKAKALDEGVRTQLAALADAIRADVKTMRAVSTRGRYAGRK